MPSCLSTTSPHLENVAIYKTSRAPKTLHNPYEGEAAPAWSASHLAPVRLRPLERLQPRRSGRRFLHLTLYRRNTVRASDVRPGQDAPSGWAAASRAAQGTRGDARVRRAAATDRSAGALSAQFVPGALTRRAAEDLAVVPPIRLGKRGCRPSRAPLRPCGAAHERAGIAAPATPIAQTDTSRGLGWTDSEMCRRVRLIWLS
jgi:hypothetical protein